MLIPILGNVISLLNRIGKSSDAATSSTTGTLHAKVANVQTEVGQYNDAANSGGSVHAKVTNIQNTVNTLMKPRTSTTLKTTITSPTSSNTYNLASYSGGAGRIKSASVYAVNSGSNGQGYYRLTIDGTVITPSTVAGYLNIGTSVYLSVNQGTDGFSALTAETGSGSEASDIDLQFKSSFSIDFICTTSGPSFYATTAYEHE